MQTVCVVCMRAYVCALQTNGIGRSFLAGIPPCFREKSNEKSCGMQDRRTSTCVCVCMRLYMLCVCMTVTDFEEVDFLWSGVNSVQHAKK